MLRLSFLLAALLLFGCNKSESTDAPKCHNGFRNQCVADTAVGSHFACALLEDRSVWCWGRNDEGQLGYTTTDLCPEDIGGGKTRSVACHTFPFQVANLEPATAVETGDSFACAIAASGGVRCWGGNAEGELGNGTSYASQTPVAVDGLSNVTALALGTRHACALADGQVWCWGANDRGQLGVTSVSTCAAPGGTMSCATRPMMVPGLTSVAQIAAGDGHTCALSADGTVTCWGDNHWGQLGTGIAGIPAPIDTSDGGLDDAKDAQADAAPSGSASRIPVMIALGTALGGVVSISTGASHTCALRDGGDVLCWGRDDHGELGAPPPAAGAMGCDGPCSALARLVPNLPPPTIVDDAGTDAMDATGDGRSSDASPDDASSVADAADEASTDASTPDASDAEAGAPVGVFGRVLSAGSAYACVRIGDGTVRCWGRDDVGQLGDGRSTNDPRAATLVIASPGAASDNPLQNVAKVRAGAASTCAVMNDGSLRCWGTNQDGALGVGHFTPQQGPVPVSW